MQIQYLEVVTSQVDAACATYSAIHGVAFGDAQPGLGGARTAQFENGGMLGIRAPLREDEAPTVRHYLLVDDIQAKIDAAVSAGATLALPPMPLPGHGTCAIVIQDSIELGFWQL